jgi:hypothetical protein
MASHFLMVLDLDGGILPSHPVLTGVAVGHSRSLSSKHLAQVSPPSLLPELVPALASFLAL